MPRRRPPSRRRCRKDRTKIGKRTPSPSSLPLRNPEKSSADAAKEARQKGKSFYHKGDFDGAISAYTEAIRLDPKSVESHDGRGAAYSHKGDNDKAIADFTEEIRVAPNSPWAYQGRGSVYKEKGDKANAEKDFEQAKKLIRLHFMSAAESVAQTGPLSAVVSAGPAGGPNAGRAKAIAGQEKATQDRSGNPRTDAQGTKSAAAAGGEKQITNSIGMKLTLVPSGEFMMGSGESAEETATFFNKNYGEDLRQRTF